MRSLAEWTSPALRVLERGPRLLRAAVGALGAAVVGGTALAGPLQELERAPATLFAHPREVEVGEPIEWTLDVVHGERSEPGLAALAEDVRAGLGPDWAWLDEDEVTRVPLPATEVDGQERRLFRSRLRWRAVALSAGEQAFPVERFAERFDLGDEAVTIAVAGVLGALEDEPRPARGFRSPDAVDARPAWQLPAAIGAAALGVLLFVWRRRVRIRRRNVAPQRATAADELRRRLDGWTAEPPKNAEDVRATYYAASRLARAVVDDQIGAAAGSNASGSVRPAPSAGLTDAEWLEQRAGDERLGALREPLRELLASVEAVKYGGAAPSPWAVQETLGHARAVLAGAEQVGGGMR